MEINNNILVETLIRGRNSAKRLQNLLCRKAEEDSVSVDDLVTEITDSFVNGLLMLNPCRFVEICGVEMSPDDLGLASLASELLTSNDNEMMSSPLVKQGRGRYNRKTMDARVEISDTSEDAYQWRKYGHKNIQNSKFPRCYYRCTHKDHHGCMATKHVQQLEQESNKYRITYFGHHTCPTLHMVSHSGPGVVLDFGSFINHGYSVSSPSTTKNIHNKSPQKQKNRSNKISLDDDGRLFPTLVSNDLMIDDFNSCYEATGSEYDGSSLDLSRTDLFENEDFFSDILVGDMLSILESL